MHSAAVHATRRAENADTGTSALLLTGSPFTAGPGSSWRSPPPHVGALWAPSLQAWLGFLSTDAATWSRVLHLAQRGALAPRASASSDSWQHDLTQAYRWAFDTWPRLTYTRRAGRMRDVVREAEEVGHGSAPRARRLFPPGRRPRLPHGRRTLATAERTAIHRTPIEAAWSLARRPVQDTCRPVSGSEIDNVGQVRVCFRAGPRSRERAARHPLHVAAELTPAFGPCQPHL
ncbi:hypothetical protein Scel_25350 [Streptomyces cellostaticus]|nr:hypothetical protein Scel_25350 [Streptomyces cellostaticus]